MLDEGGKYWLSDHHRFAYTPDVKNLLQVSHKKGCVCWISESLKNLFFLVLASLFVVKNKLEVLLLICTKNEVTNL